MRRALLTTLCLLLTVVASATERTADEAAAIAARFSAAKAPAMRGTKADLPSPELAFTQLMPSSSKAAFYVFNSDAEEGFVIVAADDHVTDILGYADGSAFDASNIDPGLRWWMAATAKCVAQAATTDIPPVTAIHPNTPVAPLLGDIEWGQSEPYNLMCPIDGEYLSVTGCVATAAAQIMRYWRWPLQGTGSHSYQWNGKTLSADFGSTRYDWDNMPSHHELYENSTQEQAVATLMYQLGVACDMYYGYDGSAATTYMMADAMTEYFSYKAGYIYQTGDDYLALINEDLDHSRPVFIAGLEGGNASAGHAFVCDGRDAKGYLHLNWGWDGANNGYFDFENLGGFGYGLELICGIEPDVNQNVPVESVAVNPSEITLKQGEKTQLQAVLTPAYATQRNVTWTSDDEAIATVDANGIVTAHTSGNARITASVGGQTASATVFVNEFVFTTPHFVRVTNENELCDGDELLIVIPDAGVAMSMINKTVSGKYEYVLGTPVTIVNDAIDLDELSEASIFTYEWWGDYAVFVNQSEEWLSAGGTNRLGWAFDGWQWEFSFADDGSVTMNALGISNISSPCLGYSKSSDWFTYNRKNGLTLPCFFRRTDNVNPDIDYRIANLHAQIDGLHASIEWVTEAPFCRIEFWDENWENQLYQTQLKGPDYAFEYDFPASGTYRYRIVPIMANGKDDIHVSGGTLTATDSAEYMPTNLTVDVDGYDAAFSWQALKPAAKYQFQILLDGEVVIDEMMTDMQATYHFIRTFDATWRVRALDARSNPLTDFADGGAFSIEGSDNDPLNLIATSTDGFTYTFSWNAGPQTARIDLELDIEIDGTLYVYGTYENVSSPYIKEFSMDGHYEWTLTAYDANGNFIGTSDGPSFTVAAPDYSVTNLKAEVNNYNVTITWDGIAPYHEIVITNAAGRVEYDKITDEHSLSFNTVVKGRYDVSVIPISNDNYYLDGCGASTSFVIGQDPAPQITSTHIEADGTVIRFYWDGPEDACYNLQLFWSGQLIGNYIVKNSGCGLDFEGLEGETFTWSICICDAEGNPLSGYVYGEEFTIGGSTPQTSEVRVYIPDDCSMDFTSGAWLWWWPEGQDGSCAPLVSEGDGWHKATLAVPEGSTIGALVVNRDVTTYGWDGAQQTIDSPFFPANSTSFAIGSNDYGKWDFYALPEGAFTDAYLPHDLATNVDGMNVTLQWQNGNGYLVRCELMKEGVVIRQDLAAGTYLPLTLNEPGTYGWRVCAADEQGRPLSRYVNGDAFTLSDTSLRFNKTDVTPIKQRIDGKIIIVRNGKRYDTKGIQLP